MGRARRGGGPRAEGPRRATARREGRRSAGTPEKAAKDVAAASRRQSERPSHGLLVRAAFIIREARSTYEHEPFETTSPRRRHVRFLRARLARVTGTARRRPGEIQVGVRARRLRLVVARRRDGSGRRSASGIASAIWWPSITVGRLGYGSVDDRVITYLSLGARSTGGLEAAAVRAARVRPPARGVDARRAGRSVRRGVRRGRRDSASRRRRLEPRPRLPLFKTKPTEMTLGIDTSGVWFPDPRGPDALRRRRALARRQLRDLIMCNIHG